MKSMEDLFHAVLQDVYFAARQLAKSLPVLADASADTGLRKTFNDRRFETQEQIVRLEQVFELIGRRARGKHCDAILGLIAEADAVIDRTAPGGLRDAGILAAAQAAKHYEIARYGTLVGWAERLNEHHAARLLRKSLDEARAADALFGKSAATAVNHAAQAA